MSNRTVVLTATLIAALSAAALSGCSASTPDAVESVAAGQNEAVESPSPSPSTGESECVPGVRIAWSPASVPEDRLDEPVSAYLVGDLMDRGPVEGAAAGEVALNADGEIESYTVAAGDSMPGIGQRFCVDEVTVSQYNHVFPWGAIHPGDVLILRPDPDEPWYNDPLPGE